MLRECFPPGHSFEQLKACAVFVDEKNDSLNRIGALTKSHCEK